jgi:hypothetical protein
LLQDHLRPAALKAGVQIPDGHRFGLHNLRHSLSHWLVNKAKVEPKVVQTILRHSRIQTTLEIYTQGDGDETRAAQGRISEGDGDDFGDDPVNCGLSCGLAYGADFPRKPKETNGGRYRI